IDCAVTTCRLVAQMSGSFASHHLSFGGTTTTTAPPGAGTTNVVQGSAEPGDSISVSGSGLTPSVSYRLLMGTSAANCRTSTLVLGGSVVSSASGTIGPVTRIIPTNSTSGVRFLCWVRVGDSANAATPDSVTIV
ncbi:MAG: hypothetical protein LC808_40295, partial [Actinobacteria bacterium]|nr:hypothetical protein [Actinomycetota bacterium]